MKRPGVVWIYSILVGLGIISAAFSLINALINPLVKVVMTTAMYYLTIILTIVILVVDLVFISKFFTLKKDSILWVYIAFGLSILANLIGQHWITAIIIAIVGWAVWDYIKKKKVDGRPVFT
ncbi:MAG: hypothetical protein KKF89_01070 [Nanoarchaeota archaeon]|nr:hypothetical protein [Nanoarchaeota archaeon]MBU1854289.1 hypothetical protein [Nanoarchaeota archaeon]